MTPTPVALKRSARFAEARSRGEFRHRDTTTRLARMNIDPFHPVTARRVQLVGFEPVAWFNGGLFDDDAALPLERDDMEMALAGL